MFVNTQIEGQMMYVDFKQMPVSSRVLTLGLSINKRCKEMILSEPTG